MLVRTIRAAVRDGRLEEPFRAQDVEAACPGFAERTHGMFLPKHRRGNPGGNSELFVQVGRAINRLL